MTMTETDLDQEARARCCVAIDVPTFDEAVELAGAMQPYFAVAKVGLELFIAEGPRVVRAMIGEGFDVFLDVKLYDIPNTVEQAAKRAGALGVRYLTVPTAGGQWMLEAGVRGFTAGRAELGTGGDGGGAAGVPRLPAGVLGVTVLTSEPEATAEVLRQRAGWAAAAGCLGVVCAAPDVPVVTESSSSLMTATPGIRLAGSAIDDQSRIATPSSAIRNGADLLIVGRTVTNAPDPVAAAAQVQAEVRRALSEIG